MMNILISAALGLPGTELRRNLAGRNIRTLGRGGKSRHADVTWNGDRGQIDAAKLEGFDAGMHLSGENVARRWSRGAKQRIFASRAEGTRLLGRSLAKSKGRL